MSNRIHGAQLGQYIERVERLREEKQALGDQEKAEGYATAYIRAVLRLRAIPPSEREEHEAMMDLYLSALGMAKETPLFRHIAGMGVDVAARESVLEALKLLAPVDGEITVKVAGAPRMRLWRTTEGVQVEEVSDAPPPPKPSAAKPSPAAATRPPAPDCTDAEAVELGREARRADQPVIANPFPWDDHRRRLWDEGWRDQDGGDGMGPK